MRPHPRKWGAPPKGLNGRRKRNKRREGGNLQGKKSMPAYEAESLVYALLGEQGFHLFEVFATTLLETDGRKGR